MRNQKSRSAVLLLTVLAVGAALRFYGVNWDAGHWLHPDERQIYFITLGLSWPNALSDALRPDSPLNPRFFAYGSFPFYLLRLVSVLLAPIWPSVREPDNLHLVGRPLAALFDLGTVYLTYRLARFLHPRCRGHGGPVGGALLAALLVSLAVLPVQLAHFYTVDTLLTFFVMLTLNLAADVANSGGRSRQLALGITLGLAVATKISAALLVLVVLSAFYTQSAGHKTGALVLARRMMPTLVLATVIVLVVQPYTLIDWRTFLEDTIRESRIAWGKLDVPYTRQYVGTLPYLYTISQTALWGLGPPLGFAAWIGFGVLVIGWLRRGSWGHSLLLAWAGPYLALTGALHTHYLRYMLPLVPILCILAVWSLNWRKSWPRSVAYAVLIAGSLVYALAFLRLYAAPHSWITASQWIYRNVPTGSTLAVEEWDTALPLPLDVDGRARRIQEYDVRTLPLYDEPDDAAKWQALAADLAESDYLIVASRRLYGSILRLPERYPTTGRYYERLFVGELGFELAGEFSRGPAWLNPRLPPMPDPAPAPLRPDESYVVYDHPRTLVFRNAERLPAEELLRRVQ